MDETERDRVALFGVGVRVVALLVEVVVDVNGMNGDATADGAGSEGLQQMCCYHIECRKQVVLRN